MKRLSIIFAAMNFIVAVAKAQAPSEFSFKQTHKITAPVEMYITTSDGFIRVNSTESNEIEAYFIVTKNNKVLDINLEELRDHLDVDVVSDGNRFEIKITQRESDWIKNWKDRYNVSLQINAPRRSSCTLKTSDGDIKLEKFEGVQHCKTSDGNISVENVKGELNAQTSDGNVNVSNIQGPTEMITSDGDINAENIQGTVNSKTSDGNISLSHVQGDNTAKTSDGNIIFEDMRGSLSAQTSDGDIGGDISQLSESLYLKTSDGDISVTVPGNMGFDITLKGEAIHTKLENFSGDTSDHFIEGKIRGGGINVELITSDGNINLNYD